MINYRLATKEDLPQIIAFYKEACDHQQYDQLDVIEGNLPADALYQKNGYQLVRQVVIDYEDVGRQKANLYELGLD